MMKKIINLISLILFLSSITFTIIFYISDKNISFIEKNRSNYNLNTKLEQLPLIKTDTNNII